jgi:hypothetical protein
MDGDARCEYRPGPGDWEIPNDWAEYLLALEGHLLILDSGTGPDVRGLIVWDLRRRGIVHEAAYHDLVALTPTHLEYWAPDGAAVTDEACPQRGAWEARGHGASLERHVRLDLRSFELEVTAALRCGARQ